MADAGNGAGRDEGARPRIGVSSCLLGEPVRFNGGHSRSRFLADELGPYVDWVPYCPEVEIGLGTPRETVRLTADGRLVNKSGTLDHTAAMAALPLPAGLDGYVFKAKSPSCGIHGIPRYAPSGQPSDYRGRGVFAKRVTEQLPLLPAEDEGRLNDAVLREEFTERVFAFARLRHLLCSPWQPADLVSFHARHKLQLLAHHPARYRDAGRVVAAAGSAPPGGNRGGLWRRLPGGDERAVKQGPQRERAAPRVQPDRTRTRRAAARRLAQPDRVLPARRGPAQRARRGPRALRERRRAALARGTDIPGTVSRRAPAEASHPALVRAGLPAGSPAVATVSPGKRAVTAAGCVAARHPGGSGCSRLARAVRRPGQAATGQAEPSAARAAVARVARRGRQRRSRRTLRQPVPGPHRRHPRTPCPPHWLSGPCRSSSREPLRSVARSMSDYSSYNAGCMKLSSQVVSSRLGIRAIRRRRRAPAASR
jgi:uncharacterized protein YbbK (DUF523 family)